LFCYLHFEDYREGHGFKGDMEQLGPKANCCPDAYAMTPLKQRGELILTIMDVKNVSAYSYGNSWQLIKQFFRNIEAQNWLQIFKPMPKALN